MAASTYLAQVQQLYIAYFGRPADPIGQAYWAGVIDAANGSIAQVLAGFSASTESQALYGNKSTIDKVTAIYANDFNRAPDAAGLAYWVAQIDSGKVTQAQAAWTIQQNAGAGDAATVQNKLTAAQAFTAQIDTTAEIQGYQGNNAAASARAFLNTVTSDNATATTAVAGAASALAAAVAVGGAVGTSYVLTAGVDALVGTSSNDTFTGVFDGATVTARTLNAGDSIDGGTGIDTLKVIVANTALANTTSTTPLAGVTVTNVETVSVQNVGLDEVVVATPTGVSTVQSLNSTATVGFTGLATGAKVNASGTGQAGTVAFAQTTAADAVNVGFTGGVNGTAIRSATVAVDGTLTAVGTATSATITSNGAANGAITANTVALTAGGATVTTLAVTADSNLRVALTAADYATSGAALTVTGSGTVNLGTNGVFKTVDATGNTGGLTVGLSNLTTSFKGSTGADTINGSTALATTAVIDGGAGIDTVAATLINSSNAAIFKNFELVDLGGATGAGFDAALMTGSTISGVTISSAIATGYAVNNLVETAAGLNVSVTGDNASNALTLGFTAASVVGTADVLNYNFTAATGTNGNAGVVTSQGIETINISSKGGTGVTNSITVVDNAAKSIVITGDHALTLTVSAQSGATSALNSIDGSAATAGLTISTAAALTATGAAGGVQSALTIKGGAGVDNITVATSAGTNSVGATVTTGAGNDIVNVTAATYNTSGSFTTITDFAKGDAIVLGNSTAGGTNSFSNVKVDVSTASSLVGALNIAASSTTATSAAALTKWFTYGGDTYVVQDVTATAGAVVGSVINSTDTVVKLSGLLDLSTSAVAHNGVTGVDTLTFA